MKTESLIKDYFSLTTYKSIICLLLISVACSVVYGYAHLIYSDSWLVLIKISAIAPLILVISFYSVTSDVDPIFTRLLMTALTFHCLGDGVIEVANIIYCIPFFLMGHLMYSAIFLRDIAADSRLSGPKDVAHYIYCCKSRLVRLSRGKSLLITGIIVGTVLAMMLLIPATSGALRVGILIYITVIIATTTLAILHPDSLSLMTLGMLLYVSSDALLAYNQFVKEVYWAYVLVWPLYYIGQSSLCLTLLAMHTRIQKPPNYMI